MRNQRILSIFTTFAILMSLIGVMPVTAKAAVSPGTITSNQTWEAQTLTAGTYTINSGVTVTITGKQTITDGNVIIKGGGKIVRASSYTGTTSASDSAMFYMTGSSSLTLNGSITVDGQNISANGPCIYMYNGSPIVNLKENTVLQNHKNVNTGDTGIYAGGAINANTSTGTLNINGGTIRNCSTLGTTGSYKYAHAGGAIYLKGTCNMTAGSITNNTASNGGAIYLASSGAVLNITGGTISGNKIASDGVGEGIYYSTLNRATSQLIIGGNANIADTIYLDNTSGELFPLITSKLQHNLTLSCNSREEGKVLAGGKDYTLTDADSKKIFMKESTLLAALNSDANQIILVTEAHKHTLVKHAAVSATCTKTGTGEYWKCEGTKGCSKIFQDSAGNTELSSIPTTPAKGHDLTSVSEKKATCTETGHTAYYICSRCSKWFTTSTANTEITDKDSVIIPAAGHNWNTWSITKEPTLTNKGTANRTCKSNSAHKESKELPALSDTSV